MPIMLETTLDGVVRTHAGEADDTEFLRLVITTILAEPDPVKLLTPMLRGYLLGRKRAIVRTAEHTAWRDFSAEGTRIRVTGAEAISAGSPVMRERLQPLLDETIFVPGYGKVKWGEATVAQFEARIAMYARQAEAITAAIADVQDAVRLITECPGATCLNDVYRQE